MSRKKRKQKRRIQVQSDAPESLPKPEFVVTDLHVWWKDHLALGVALIAGLMAAFAWAYWPTLQLLWYTWGSHADYSHGYLVCPLAILFLYLRRDRMPDTWSPAWISGGALLMLSIFVRWAGARIYLDALDGYSILIWAAGVIVLCFGWRVFWWASPSLMFLLFMIPMPFRVETALRLPLQALATQISTYALVVLGYPALAETNVIRIGESTFGIAEACSGLRIFVGILALAVGYVIAVRRAAWIKVLLIASVLPVTLVANSTRIVVTCLLELQFSSAAAQKFSHDIAGLVMIPFAALLFGLILWYLVSIVKWQDSVSVDQVLKSQIAN